MDLQRQESSLSFPEVQKTPSVGLHHTAREQLTAQASDQDQRQEKWDREILLPCLFPHTLGICPRSTGSSVAVGNNEGKAANAAIGPRK